MTAAVHVGWNEVRVITGPQVNQQYPNGSQDRCYSVIVDSENTNKTPTYEVAIVDNSGNGGRYFMDPKTGNSGGEDILPNSAKKLVNVVWLGIDAGYQSDLTVFFRPQA